MILGGVRCVLFDRIGSGRSNLLCASLRRSDAEFVSSLGMSLLRLFLTFSGDVLVAQSASKIYDPIPLFRSAFFLIKAGVQGFSLQDQAEISTRTLASYSSSPGSVVAGSLRAAPNSRFCAEDNFRDVLP